MFYWSFTSFNFELLVHHLRIPFLVTQWQVEIFDQAFHVGVKPCPFWTWAAMRPTRLLDESGAPFLSSHSPHHRIQAIQIPYWAKVRDNGWDWSWHRTNIPSYFIDPELCSEVLETWVVFHHRTWWLFQDPWNTQRTQHEDHQHTSPNHPIPGLVVFRGFFLYVPSIYLYICWSYFFSCFAEARAGC